MEAILSVGQAAQERAAEMARAAEQARELMRSKEMFFAMVSHEMRTPLTTCIGMAEVCVHNYCVCVCVFAPRWLDSPFQTLSWNRQPMRSVYVMC